MAKRVLLYTLMFGGERRRRASAHFDSSLRNDLLALPQQRYSRCHVSPKPGNQFPPPVSLWLKGSRDSNITQCSPSHLQQSSLQAALDKRYMHCEKLETLTRRTSIDDSPPHQHQYQKPQPAPTRQKRETN